MMVNLKRMPQASKEKARHRRRWSLVQLKANVKENAASIKGEGAALDFLVLLLVLLHALLDGRVHELRHLDVVCEHVERYVAALGYGDELFLVVVVVRILLILSIHVGILYQNCP